MADYIEITEQNKGRYNLRSIKGPIPMVHPDSQTVAERFPSFIMSEDEKHGEAHQAKAFKILRDGVDGLVQFYEIVEPSKETLQERLC